MFSKQGIDFARVDNTEPKLKLPMCKEDVYKIRSVQSILTVLEDLPFLRITNLKEND